MKNKEEKTQYRIYMQYVLIGAAIGLYYGLFFRPTGTEPDFLMAILLSLAASIVTVVIRSWKKGRPFSEILIDFLKILSMFSAFMVGLEIRKVIYNEWGRTVVIVFTTTLGVLIGFVAAIRRKTDEKKSNE